MPAKGQLRELSKYIAGFEVGLTIRLDDLGSRLQAIESNITLLGTRLVAGVRSETDAKETSPDDSGL